MEKQKRKFPYWVHIVLGIIWVGVGVVLHSGIEMAIWVAGGLVILTIGFLNKK